MLYLNKAIQLGFVFFLASMILNQINLPVPRNPRHVQIISSNRGCVYSHAHFSIIFVLLYKKNKKQIIPCDSALPES